MVVSAETRRNRLSLLQGFFPFDRSHAVADMVAGITLAALAIPEVMGYTKIAGTPEITGLYTMLVPMILYAVFGGSRHLVVGADSATAAILASGIASMAVPRSAEWVALAGVLALMAGLFMFLARIFKLGFLADFLSRTALIGFLTGVGIQVAIGEISGMLGLPGGGKGTIEKMSLVLQQLDRMNVAVVAVSLSVLVLIAGLRRIERRVPAAIIAVIASIVASWAIDLGRYGVPLLGEIPQGLPSFGLPHIVWDMELIKTLMPTAFSMFVVILTQSAMTSRAYAFRNHDGFNENSDMIGLGMANIGAGLTGAFVVNGSPTKTQMVESAGGKSQLAHLTTSMVVLLVLLFFTAPLAYMPKAVLSAIVFLIGVELVDMRGIVNIYRERPWEFWVAVITAGVVVFVGVEQSIILAMVMSLIAHTRHGYRPNNMLLVSDETLGWLEQPISNPVQATPGLMIYRFMHNMYYANSQILTEEINRLMKDANPPLKWFCIDGSAVNDVDFTAAEALRSLYDMLSEVKVSIVFCEITDHVMAEFDRSGLTPLFGREAFFPTPNAVVKGFCQEITGGNREGDEKRP
jgi:high affinity sulfate transporter 1